jgi:hypothetical protein
MQFLSRLLLVITFDHGISIILDILQFCYGRAAAA